MLGNRALWSQRDMHAAFMVTDQSPEYTELFIQQMFIDHTEGTKLCNCFIKHQIEKKTCDWCTYRGGMLLLPSCAYTDFFCNLVEFLKMEVIRKHIKQILVIHINPYQNNPISGYLLQQRVAYLKHHSFINSFLFAFHTKIISKSNILHQHSELTIMHWHESIVKRKARGFRAINRM